MCHPEDQPPGFVPICQIHKQPYGKQINVVGLVTDAFTPRQTRRDWQLTFKISVACVSPAEIKVSFFKEDRHDLPRDVKEGAVVALQNIKVNHYQDVRSLLSSHKTAWAVFDVTKGAEQGVIKSESTGFKHHERLLDCARRLKLGAPSKAPSSGSVSGVRMERSPSLIKDVVVDKFHDLTGEVIKMYTAGTGAVDLHITDYTRNNLLPEYLPQDAGYGNDKKWDGPYGKRSLKIEVYDPHATWLRDNAERGSLLRLRNVRIKIGKGALLEGNLWEDRLYPEKVCVWSLTDEDPAVQQLLGRKTGYASECRSKGWANALSGLSARSRKRAPAEENGALGRADAGRRNKKHKKSQRQEHTHNPHEKTQDPQSPVRLAKARSVVRLVASASSMRPSSIYEVVNNPSRSITIPLTGEKQPVPFVNVKHKIRVKVVDFFPHEIKSFAEKRPLENDGAPKWVWNFILRVIPADKLDPHQEAIDVEVSGDHAVRLLGGMPPGDLNKDEGYYYRLRTVLDVMWQDLAQKKDEAWAGSGKNPSTWQHSLEEIGKQQPARPIELCISEEGVRTEELTEADKHKDETLWQDKKIRHSSWGWSRVWRVCDTVIADESDDFDG